MFEQSIAKCIKECKKELVTSKNTKIQKYLTEILSETEEEIKDDLLESLIINSLSAAFDREYQKEKMEDIVLSLLQDIKELIPLRKKSYTFNITLKGLEKEIYRSIKVPGMISLGDLGYLILSIFNTDSSHLFEFVIGQERYKCEAERYDEGFAFDEDNKYALDYVIYDLDFKVNSTFTLEYDYGEDYQFSIQVFSVNHEDVFQSIETIEVTDGKGFGIWEDAHYALDLYYSNRKEFDAFIKDNAIDSNFYPVNEEFDLDDCNEYLLSSFLKSKLAYEEKSNNEES